MSIVADQVRRVDSQLDRVHLVPQATRDEFSSTEQTIRVSSSPRILELQSIVKALSTTSSSSPLLSSWRISKLLEQADLSEVVIESEEDPVTRDYETELEWLLVSKATVQTYGLLLNTLLEQTIPLNDDIWYWDEVLGSYTYTSLYTIQTSPLRFWAWSKDIYSDTRRRLARLGDGQEESISTRDIGTSLTNQWKQFYGLVRESIRERSIADIQRRVLSPIALCRSEARQNQARLKRLREMGASGLGVLMDEGLSFDIDNEDNSESVKAEENDSHEWKMVVERSVALMDTVLRNVTTLETGVSEFEDTVFATVEDDPEISIRDGGPQGSRPAKLSDRLQHILEVHVPNHITSSHKLVSEYGRPSRLVRYWLPASLLLLSSSTLLRIFVNRRAEIIEWIRDFGATARDFWFNWVIEPVKKVIGTIRHDKDSEVAIMSKESLKGDRDSLERMVVDFAIDNPQTAVGVGNLSEAQISEIRMKVKEGDLTPVLRAYEKDLRQPFMGTVRGDLVRTLLIQVQKTKVDVEVAISGIDALLKSQELVFGFVGLTPGVLVCVAAFRYLGGVFGNRRGLKQGQKAGQTVRVLRNIDRILTLATPTQNNLLSYKDHGLLLCEVHVLRKRAHRLFPGEIEREFLEDVADLCNINSGIQAQLKVLERIRWGYAKWLR
ncbi:related to NCA2 protein [Phialocephala subalpina]|uniref:Related to NCA2 protein n=1 Tax=Phialocephala subalpina TaxID=576137 RepID=A0A1L7XFU8_9HELO|nr:related to NCA2 protein [Phialocephala subalpina]